MKILVSANYFLNSFFFFRHTYTYTSGTIWGRCAKRVPTRLAQFELDVPNLYVHVRHTQGAVPNVYLRSRYLSKIRPSSNYFMDVVFLRVGNIENSSKCELFPRLVFFFSGIPYSRYVCPSSNYFLDFVLFRLKHRKFVQVRINFRT